MLTYHKNGLTISLKLDNADELEDVQNGLINALLTLAAHEDSLNGPVIHVLTRLLDATRLQGKAHEQATAYLKSKAPAVPSAA